MSANTRIDPNKLSAKLVLNTWANTRINFNKLLTYQYCITNSGNHIYEIGFIRQRIGDDYDVKKEKYQRYKQLCFKLIYIIALIRTFISICIKNSGDKIFIFNIIGKFDTSIESVRIHFNIYYGLMVTVALCGQLLHEQFSSPSSPWLEPFLMMRGLITPSDNGINDEIVLKKLLKRYLLISIFFNFFQYA